MSKPDSPKDGPRNWRQAVTKAFPPGYCVGSALLLLAAVVLPQAATEANDGAKRFHEAQLVLQAGLSGADAGISQDLLDRADCVGVFPNVLKVAVLIGGQFGKGIVSCRSGAQPWSSPSNFRIEGGNIGLQLGGSSTDLVLLFIGSSSVDKLLRTKFTLGVDASAAAGPAGRSAAGKTDALFGAEIVSYSRSRGLFAGISLEGATLRPAHKENRHLYGYDPDPRALFNGEVPPPHAAQGFLEFLREHSPHRRSEDSEVAEASGAPDRESAPRQALPARP